MEIIDLHELCDCPAEVTVGISKIKGELNAFGLSELEQNEFSLFKNDQRKAEFLSVRQLFRYVLEQRGVDASKVKLTKDELGKPIAELNGSPIHISFSHSKEYVFCAVSPNFEIGLDAEPLNRTINQRIVNRILNEEERQHLSGVSPFKLWTIKEAVVKCLGTGLRTNLNELTISKNNKNRFSVRFNDDICFEICIFQQSNHQIALAYQSSNR